MNRHVKALSLLLALQLIVLGGVLVWQQRAATPPAGYVAEQSIAARSTVS